MNNGGSAFPIMGNKCVIVEPGHAVESFTCIDKGLTVRDWFAGQALAGMCSNGQMKEYDPKGLAKWIYDIADAMLAEREKNNEQKN